MNHDTIPPVVGENEAIIEAIERLTNEANTARDRRPKELGNGLYLVQHDNGDLQLHDFQDDIATAHAKAATKTGIYAFRNIESLAGYLDKHGLTQTELTAHLESDSITAVIDAHTASDGDTDPGAPGAGQHRAVLQLATTQDWKDWTRCDNTLVPQVDFAEFVEDHMPNFITPNAGEMYELAQSIRVAKSGNFESSKRLNTGETTLEYTETHAATAGKKGALTIPDKLELAIRVYEHGTPYKVEARFRYRITNEGLRLGYRLIRIQDVHQAAFTAVCEETAKATGRDIWQS